MTSKIKNLLHPIRMNIMQSLLGEKELTTQEISQIITDVPQATLYRHLNKLHAAGLIKVVDHNKIRGTVEKTYALSKQLEAMTRQEMRQASRQDHFEIFFSFLTLLLTDYEKYLQQEQIDLEEDGVSFRQASLYLSDEELTDFIEDFRKILSRAMQNKPAPERKLKTLSTIILPRISDEEKQEF